MADRAVEKRDTKYHSNAVTVRGIARCLGWTFIYLKLNRLPSDADIKWLKDRPPHWVILAVCGSELKAEDAFNVLREHDWNIAVGKGKLLYFEREVITLSADIEPKLAIEKILERYDVEVGKISLEFNESDTADDRKAVECQPEKEATNGRHRYWKEHPDEWSSIQALAGTNEDLERARLFCSFLRRKKGTSLKDISADETARLVEEYFKKQKLGRVKQDKLLEVLNGARLVLTSGTG